MTSKRLVTISGILLTASMALGGTELKLTTGSFDPLSVQEEMLSHVGSANTEFIVQLKQFVTESDKAFFRKNDIQVLGYLPEDAVVVRSTAHSLITLAQKYSAIRAIIPYEADFKLSKNLGQMSVFNQDQNVSVVIRTFVTGEAEEVSAQINKISSDILIQDIAPGLVTASVPRKLIPVIAKMTGVEHIGQTQEMVSFHAHLATETDVVATAAGDYSDLTGDESGTKVMNFAPVWAAGYTGRGQIASMADTGLDSGDINNIHPDFQGAVNAGHIFGLFSKSWGDPMGHGTHVAGSISGRGTLSAGVLKGGAYESQFVAQGIWSPMMKNLSVPSKLNALFEKAYAAGARVHSNSWGGAQSFGAYDSYARQVDEWNFTRQEMTILFAAGNSGTDANKDGRIDENSMASPGTAKNCVTVGASENVTKTGGIQVPISKLRSGKDAWGAEPIFSSLVSDNANGMAMFSSRGPTTDGRIKPDVSAPGTNILSTRSLDKASSPLWGAYNDFYAWSGGTSMATPLTAGAATVARQYLTQEIGLSEPSGALVKATLMHTAVDMFPGQYGQGGAAAGQELLVRRPNSDEGYGRVDASGILNLKKAILIDDKVGLSTGTEKSIEVTLAQGSVLANLVYIDAPGSENAQKSLVNDLDLLLVKLDGSVVASNDRTNNHEIIELSGLPAGRYTLKVRGHNVPAGIQGKQPFALVITGQ